MIDEVVARAADLAKARPEPAALKPQIEALYEPETTELGDHEIVNLLPKGPGDPLDIAVKQTYPLEVG